jgi:hypothetical protein
MYRWPDLAVWFHIIEKDAPMARFVDAIARSLSRKQYEEPRVHFHARPDEQPEVCYDEDCMRPRLRVE